MDVPIILSREREGVIDDNRTYHFLVSNPYKQCNDHVNAQALKPPGQRKTNREREKISTTQK